jgi:hypothetical protein
VETLVDLEEVLLLQEAEEAAHHHEVEEVLALQEAADLKVEDLEVRVLAGLDQLETRDNEGAFSTYISDCPFVFSLFHKCTK